MNQIALDMAWTLGGGALTAFVAMLAITPLVIRGAHAMDWLAYPQSDRWHTTPTALMGGIAIYSAATLAVLICASGAGPWWVWGGATIMFVTGLVDDLYDVQPVGKLLAQVAATGLLLSGGYAFGPDWPFWIAVPVTFLWVIGVTNALNLLDNMDGLAAGIAAIVAGVLAVFALLVDSTLGGTIGFVAAGAAGGFLIFNFKPARIFMGDCGSLFLGYVIAAVTLIVQNEAGAAMHTWAAYLIPVAALAVPIFDTTFVTAARTLAGRPVAEGGRDHTSHRLVFLGLSERHAVLVLYGISLLAGGLALTFLFVEARLFYALFMFAGVGLAVFGIYLGRANVYRENEKPITPTIDKSPLASSWMQLPRAVMGAHWKLIFGALADLLLVVASFICAYYLRFENGAPPAHEVLLERALPVVAFLKIAVFYVMGLYQSIWRHAGTPELIRVLKATALSSLLVFVVLSLWFGVGRLSTAALFIDWMLVTIAVTAVRFGFRGLRNYLAFRRKNGRRTLLYGAGDAGVLVLREIRHNAELGLTPVGFVDDDAFKQGQVVQGVDVLGTGEELAQICREHEVEEVLITSFRLSETRKRAIARLCREMDLSCHQFYFTFESLLMQSEPEAIRRYHASDEVPA